MGECQEEPFILSLIKRMIKMGETLAIPEKETASAVSFLT